DGEPDRRRPARRPRRRRRRRRGGRGSPRRSSEDLRDATEPDSGDALARGEGEEPVERGEDPGRRVLGGGVRAGAPDDLDVVEHGAKDDRTVGGGAPGGGDLVGGEPGQRPRRGARRPEPTWRRPGHHTLPYGDRYFPDRRVAGTGRGLGSWAVRLGRRTGEVEAVPAHVRRDARVDGVTELREDPQRVRSDAEAAGAERARPPTEAGDETPPQPGGAG